MTTYAEETKALERNKRLLDTQRLLHERNQESQVDKILTENSDEIEIKNHRKQRSVSQRRFKRGAAAKAFLQPKASPNGKTFFLRYFFSPSFRLTNIALFCDFMNRCVLSQPRS